MTFSNRFAASLLILLSPQANAYDPFEAYKACGGMLGSPARYQPVTLDACMAEKSKSAPPMIGPGRPVTGAELAQAKDAVTRRMKDPLSAQFRNVTYHERTGSICGEVNAKNSYGGYVGFSPFSVTDGKETVMPASGDVLVSMAGESAIRKACE